MQRYAILLFFLCATAIDSLAQPTNLEALQTLAIQCVDFAAKVEQDLLIDAPADMPFVRSAIISKLNAGEREVFLVDSIYTNQPTSLATLRYRIDGTHVSYKRLKKKKARRVVEFIASASLISVDGKVLEDKTCQEQFTDTVRLSDLNALETSSYSETKAPHPEAGFFKRVFQPVMLTAATALTVYLFFTLRSESSNDG